MDLFGNKFHIFAGKSKGKGYTGDRNVTTGVSLWESKKEKAKKEKPNDPISKTTVKAPW